MAVIVLDRGPTSRHLGTRRRGEDGRHAGQAFGLAIPQFHLVEIEEELLQYASLEARAIGTGRWFGSLRYPVASKFQPFLAARIPREQQRDVAVFDWWIRNGDRTQGNPNLLFDAAEARLIVFDHNLAFDADCTLATFRAYHVFAEAFEEVLADWVLRQAYADRLARALPPARAAYDEAPAAWVWRNPEGDLPCDFDATAVFATLERCKTERLWTDD